MNQTDTPNIRPPLERFQRPGLVIGLVGLAVSLAGAFIDPEQFWRSYLLAYLFWLEISLGCLAVLMLHHLVGGRWGLAIRRLLEAGAMTLPLLALLFVPLLFGLQTLYIWTNPEALSHSELLQHKSAYLNIPFFLSRTVIYFIVWLGIAYLLNRWSLEQKRTGEPGLSARMRRLSGLGMVLYVVTATFAAYDWMMSLEPEWSSSIYGLLFIVGQVLAAFALAIVGLRFVSKDQPAAAAGAVPPWTTHFNDLGNFTLGLVMIWAYITFSQFLIIWSANISEEAVWYYQRSQGGWLWVGVFLVLFHFVLPFLLLLSRRAKRRARLLSALAMGLLFMRLVDLYWLIAPAFYPVEARVHWLDLTILVAMGGGGSPCLSASWPESPSCCCTALNCLLTGASKVQRWDS